MLTMTLNKGRQKRGKEFQVVSKSNFNPAIIHLFKVNNGKILTNVPHYSYVPMVNF